MKYKLIHRSLPIQPCYLICLRCGHEKATTIPIYPGGIRPNTTPTKGPGSWLGCMLGSHDYYFDYEVEKIR